jgi:hypothetical protein
MLARTQSMNRKGGATTTSTPAGTPGAAALSSPTSFSTDACVPLHFQLPPTKKLPVEAAHVTARRDDDASEAGRRSTEGVGCCCCCCWAGEEALRRSGDARLANAARAAAWARAARAGAPAWQRMVCMPAALRIAAARGC